MHTRAAHRLAQFVDDMGRGRLVGVAHTQIYNVPTRSPGFVFESVYTPKHIRRQPRQFFRLDPTVKHCISLTDFQFRDVNPFR